MNDVHGYAVFFFPQALEVLGDAIRPHLQDGAAGPHVRCHEVDTGGAFVELTLHGQGPDGRGATLELMVPSAMVRMIASVQSEGVFGFSPRGFDAPVPLMPALGPGAPPAAEATAALPEPGVAPVQADADDARAKPGA